MLGNGKSLSLPLPPSVNRLWATNRWGKRVLTKEGRNYKSTAQWEARRQIMPDPPIPKNQLAALIVRVYRKRKSGDLDNFFKAVFDALEGIVYENDSQIVEIHAYRRDDKQNPRIEIQVQPPTRKWQTPPRRVGARYSMRSKGFRGLTK